MFRLIPAVVVFVASLSPAHGQLTLPYFNSVMHNFTGAHPGAFTIRNTGTGDSRALVGWASANIGNTTGVWGECDSATGRGVMGRTTAANGWAVGVQGESMSLSGRGVVGWARGTTGQNTGVWGESASTNGIGVVGMATAATGATHGGSFLSISTTGRGVYGLANATTGITYGGEFESRALNGTGVEGRATAEIGFAVGGRFVSASSSGVGVLGRCTALTGTTYAGFFQHASPGGAGVHGSCTAATGTNYGGYFQSASTSGRGAFGWALASTGVTHGGYFQTSSPDGRGVTGYASSATGTCYGVFGESASASGVGVFGNVTSTAVNVSMGGRFENSTLGGGGVFARARHLTSAFTYGVWGDNNSPDGWGVYGSIAAGGTSATRAGVYFGNGLRGTGTKAFQMDHPLDPENAYLNHYCTEAPEPLNVYSGNIVTDAAGYATVALPSYFESINRDFRYQLTIIDEADDADFVQAKVARKIRDNQFVIRTSKPGVEVSWRVEAARNDLWVRAYGAPVEVQKPAEHRGRYLCPELYGKSAALHILPRPADPPAALDPDEPRGLPTPRQDFAEPKAVSGGNP